MEKLSLLEITFKSLRFKYHVREATLTSKLLCTVENNHRFLACLTTTYLRDTEIKLTYDLD